MFGRATIRVGIGPHSSCFLNYCTCLFCYFVLPVWWIKMRWDLLASLGHRCKFQRVSRLGSVTARHASSGRQPNCGVQQRAPPVVGRAAITLGISPHSSLCFFLKCMVYTSQYTPSVRWHCWLGVRKSMQSVKKYSNGASYLHMVQLMPLPPHHPLLR